MRPAAFCSESASERNLFFTQRHQGLVFRHVFFAHRPCSQKIPVNLKRQIPICQAQSQELEALKAKIGTAPATQADWYRPGMNVLIIEIRESSQSIRASRSNAVRVVVSRLTRADSSCFADRWRGNVRPRISFGFGRACMLHDLVLHMNLMCADVAYIYI